MSKWLSQLQELQQRGQPAIAVAVAATRGSVPREAGTRMLVTTDEVLGTVGGGHLEFKAIDIARGMLGAGEFPLLHRFPLGASLGQCCGGLVQLLFEPVRPASTWVGQLLALQQRATPCVVITPVHGDRGKLLVTGDATIGTLGNAVRDRAATALARDCLASRQLSTLRTIAGEECFVEVIPAADFSIMLFGAGHVGRALVKILGDLPCNVAWVDSRDDQFPAAMPAGVVKLVNDAPEQEADHAAPGTYFLVMTHSHQLDQAICERILRRQDYAYFGLIGSLSKRRQFERRLSAKGFAPEQFANMVCPIGDRGIESKEPMAIAISVVRELLLRRQTLDGTSTGTSDWIQMAATQY